LKFWTGPFLRFFKVTPWSFKTLAMVLAPIPWPSAFRRTISADFTEP